MSVYLSPAKEQRKLTELTKKTKENTSFDEVKRIITETAKEGKFKVVIPTSQIELLDIIEEKKKFLRDIGYEVYWYGGFDVMISWENA